MRKILLLKTMRKILLLNARGNMREPGESLPKSVPELMFKQVVHQAYRNLLKEKETLKAQGTASTSIPAKSSTSFPSESTSDNLVHTIEGMIRTLAPIAIHQAAKLAKTMANRRRKPA